MLLNYLDAAGLLMVRADFDNKYIFCVENIQHSKANSIIWEKRVLFL